MESGSLSGPICCLEGAWFARLDDYSLGCIAKKLRPLDLHAFISTCRRFREVAGATVHRLRTGRRSTFRQSPETLILQGQHNLSARFPFLSHLDVRLVDNLDLSSLSCLKHLASLLLYVPRNLTPEPEPVDRLQDLTCLRGLERLAVEADYLDRLQLDALWQLTWLRSLRFRGFRLWVHSYTSASEPMRGISCLAHLQELTLPEMFSTSLRPDLPKKLPASLSSLEFHVSPDRLNLRNLGLSGESGQSADHEQLSRLVALRELIVWGFCQQGCLLLALTSFSSLTRLELHKPNNGISSFAIRTNKERNMPHVEKLMGLRALHLDLEMDFTDEGLDCLCSISSLESLHVEWLNVQRLTALSKLYGLNLLTSLTILCGIEETDRDGSHRPEALGFLTGLSLLRHLKGVWYFRRDAGLPVCLGSIVHATQLESLDLSGYGDATYFSGDIEYIRVLTRLTYLSLRYCQNLATGLLPVITELPSLQDLDVSCCYNLSGQALSHLSSLTDLRKISLAGNSWVGDGELLMLELCAGLEAVDVRDCEVTASGLKRLCERVRLRELAVGSYNARKEDVASLRGPLGCCRVYLDGKYAYPDFY